MDDAGALIFYDEKLRCFAVTTCPSDGTLWTTFLTKRGHVEHVCSTPAFIHGLRPNMERITWVGSN